MVVTSLNPDVPYQKCSDEKNRLATQTCLQGLMVAAATKDFRNTAMPLLAKFVRHFSLMAIVQQHGALITWINQSFQVMDTRCDCQTNYSLSV